MGDLIPLRCYYCGNPYTDAAPLTRSREDWHRLVHQEDEDGEPACPPISREVGSCAKCHEARPLADMVLMGRKTTKPGDGLFGALYPLNIPADTDAQVDEAAFLFNRPVVICRRGGCADTGRSNVPGYDDEPTRRVKEDRTEEQSRDIPVDGDGMTIADLVTLLGIKERAVRDLVRRGLDAGTLRYEEVPTRAGGAPRKVYWRVDR